MKLDFVYADDPANNGKQCIVFDPKFTADENISCSDWQRNQIRFFWWLKYTIFGPYSSF